MYGGSYGRFGRGGGRDTLDNVDTLETVLLSHLPEGPPLYPDDYLTDQSARSPVPTSACGTTVRWMVTSVSPRPPRVISS